MNTLTGFVAQAFRPATAALMRCATRAGFIVLSLALSTPLAAQTRRPTVSGNTEPKLTLRPFFLATGQQFTAKTTFNAVFGSPTAEFWGGGLQLVLRNGVYIDVSASRFSKTGQRAFLDNGQTYRLGIPLTATVTPFEVTGGYRFRLPKHRSVIPYVGGGIGSYAYTEASAFADAGDDIDTRHAGFLVVGGAEFRVHRWVGIAADLQYTHITGVLGTGGISKEAGDDDLGGGAVRVKVVVGR